MACVVEVQCSGVSGGAIQCVCISAVIASGEIDSGAFPACDLGLRVDYSIRIDSCMDVHALDAKV